METESEEDYSSPPRPDNWGQEIAKIESNPITHSSVMVKGVNILSGIYLCNGVKNDRPYYLKFKPDKAIWYDPSEKIWAITDRSALNDIDPELYGYFSSSAWDVTRVPKNKHWMLADHEGKWRENRNINIVPFEWANSPFSNHDTTLSYKQWTLSTMSSFWEEMHEMKTLVGHNTKNMEVLTREISRLTEVTEAFGNHEERITKLESLVRSSHPKARGQSRRRRAKAPPGWTLDEYILHGKMEVATKAIMTNWLKVKQREGVKLAGRLVTVSGKKATLVQRIRAILEQQVA